MTEKEKRRRKLLLRDLLLSIEDPKVMESFLDDLLYNGERTDLPNRVAAAELANQGLNHKEIVEKLNLGKQTVTRVTTRYRNGKGYQTVLDKSKKKTSRK